MRNRSVGRREQRTPQAFPSEGRPDIAFYYPGPMWMSGDAIKNSLLFFDGVALLTPDYMSGKPVEQDPVLAQPLLEQGLLHLVKPETFITAAATERMVTAMLRIVDLPSFTAATKQSAEFHAISLSRMGYNADSRLAKKLHQELRKRHLAENSRDGVSVPMHPIARYLILTLWSQLLRPVARDHNLEFEPLTDRPDVTAALREILELPGMPSAAHVLEFDIQTVGIDLGALPLDEVLDFRKREGKRYRAYARDLRHFIAELAPLDERQRERLFKDRREEIAEEAHELQEVSRRAWRRPATIGLGLLGAAWAAVSNNPIAAAISLGGLVAGSGSKQTDSAYSYLFTAATRFY